jgi:hypothetical protein
MSFMSYSFAGFFVRPPLEPPSDLPAGAVWRAIEEPFVGSGVRLPDLLGKTPAPAEVKHLACRLGFAATSDWIFITYSCWAGRIELVYGFGSRGGRPFGPIDGWAVDECKVPYVRLMADFGVAPEDALNFTPFRRGFWGSA